MNLIWELHEEVEPEARKKLAGELRIPELIIRVLLNRGLNTAEKIRNFFQPDFNQLHNPFLMKDMERAVERTIEALVEKQRIFIYGDYDVDGITAVSLLYLFLRDMGGEVRYYIPDRQLEGYGISKVGIAEAINWQADLIISVDCGITSVDEVKMALEANIDVIVSDHHEPAEILPQAFAVLDPKRSECDYPFKELAGVGVAYKLAQGISTRWGLSAKSHEKYIDLVAIGSAADIVPLIDENRVLVKHGLAKVNETGGIGISSLIETAGLKESNISVGQIVFGLAPRINAVGRLGSAGLAVELLTTRDADKAHEIAEALEKENQRRKSIDNQTLEEARKKIAQDYHFGQDKAIVLSERKWHSGVIGIVASRIIEQYYRPTIMIAIEDGIGKGSARSIPGFDIFSALKGCSDLLMQYGGHKYAAGLTIEEAKISAFTERFKKIAYKLLKDEDLIPKIEIDAEITLDQITSEVTKYLDFFEPYGPKNQKPLFMARNLDVLNPRSVGSHAQHIRFRVRQNGVEIDTIGFNLSEKFGDVIMENPRIDMVFGIEKNAYNNRVQTQLQVKDLR
jgi:single-stranded-DNA-specific exonuclease